MAAHRSAFQCNAARESPTGTVLELWDVSAQPAASFPIINEFAYNRFCAGPSACGRDGSYATINSARDQRCR